MRGGSFAKGALTGLSAGVKLLTLDPVGAFEDLASLFSGDDGPSREDIAKEQYDYWATVIPTINQSLREVVEASGGTYDELARQAQQLREMIKKYQDQSGIHPPEYYWSKGEPVPSQQLPEEVVRLNNQLSEVLGTMEKPTPLALDGFYIENPLRRPWVYTEAGPGGKEMAIPMFVDGRELPRLIGDDRWSRLLPAQPKPGLREALKNKKKCGAYVCLSDNPGGSQIDRRRYDPMGVN